MTARGERFQAFAAVRTAALATLTACGLLAHGCGSAGALRPTGPRTASSFGTSPAIVQSVGQASVDALDLIVAAPTAKLAAALASIEPGETTLDARVRRRLAESGVWVAVGRLEPGPGGIGAVVESLSTGPGGVSARDELRIPRPESWTGLPASVRRGRAVTTTHLGAVTLDAGEMRLLVRAWPIPPASSGDRARLRLKVVPQHVPAQRAPSVRLAEAAAAPAGPDGATDVRTSGIDEFARGIVFRSLALDVELAADEALVLTAWDPGLDVDRLAADWAQRLRDGTADTPAPRLIAPSTPEPGPLGPAMPRPDPDSGSASLPSDAELPNGSTAASERVEVDPLGPVAPRPSWLGESVFAAADDAVGSRLRDATVGRPRRLIIIAPRLPDVFTLFPEDHPHGRAAGPRPVG